MKPLAVALTGISKSSNTSVSYFLFWHNQSSKLSRHDRIWQVPRTLAKLHKEKKEGSRSGCSLPISLASCVFGRWLLWRAELCPTAGTAPTDSSALLARGLAGRGKQSTTSVEIQTA